MPFTESRRRFEEYLDIILQAWTTESLSYAGEYFSCQEVTVSPKPYQTPSPPISVGITSAETFPIIGRQGYAIIINPSRVFALAELAPYIQGYRQAWKEAGHPGAGKVGLRLPVYVAESAARAYAEPQESTLHSMRRLGERVASYGSREGTTGDWSSEGQRILDMNYDDWLRDKVAYGTPDAVADRLGQLRDELTLDQIIYEINFGNQLPFALQMKNLRLMQEKVIPQLT